MMNRFTKFFKANTWGILSGVLVGISFLPPSPPWFLLVCYVPLWTSLLTSNAKPKAAFRKAWWTQFVLTLVGFYFVASVAHEFGFMPWPLAISVLLVFAALMHLYIPLAAALTSFLHHRLGLGIGLRLLLLAGLTSLGEAFWPSIFPWNLGYPLYWIKSPIAQWADTIGFWGLSLLVYLINALIALAFLLFQQQRKRAVSILLAVPLIVLGLQITGRSRAQTWQSQKQHLDLLLVQANIGNNERYLAEKGLGAQQFIADRYIQLTQKALKEYPQPDLVVWPEAAFPDFLNPEFSNRTYSKQFYNFQKGLGLPLLTGAYSAESRDGKRHEYNGYFLFDKDANLLGSYHKTYLLVFGEYTPFSQWFPFLAKISPAGSGFQRGDGPKSIDFGPWKIGAQNCYESLYPEFSATLAKQGSDLIINLTNDSWFGPTHEPYQHLYMTLARSIEVRRPLVRSTNTGISSVALADGSWLERSPLFEPWYAQYEVAIQKEAPLSFYTRFGTWLPWLLLLILAALVLPKFRQNRGEPKSGS